MKFKELKNHSDIELKKMLLDLRSEAHEIAVKIRLNQQKQIHKLRAVKKDIARIMTFLSSNKSGQ
ncbi:MAG: 50S ribosomal protein L29 [Candidatus Doudnabacteria bacterium]|nr:50S ribosomal protein L29 [Candidatus Doudnabacteria bacterium]